MQHPKMENSQLLAPNQKFPGMQRNKKIWLTMIKKNQLKLAQNDTEDRTK